MKKIIYSTGFVLVLLVSFLGVTYSYEYNDYEGLKFELIGDSIIDVDVNSEYIEYGIKVTRGEEDVSSLVNVDKSLVNTKVLGKYKVKYEIDLDGTKEYIYRIVNVVDRTSPEIVFNDDDIVYLDLNDVYLDPGVMVVDNYDKDLNDKVLVSGEVDTGIVGEYKIEYRVVDSSGNEAMAIRYVIVR